MVLQTTTDHENNRSARGLDELVLGTVSHWPSLHSGLNAPPTASQAFVPGGASKA
jgi:hypothetical protein